MCHYVFHMFVSWSYLLLYGYCYMDKKWMDYERLFFSLIFFQCLTKNKDPIIRNMIHDSIQTLE